MRAHDHVEVFDTRLGGAVPRAYDRYTVIIKRAGCQHGDVYVMSEDPNTPHGVNMYCGDDRTINRAGLGEHVRDEDLPAAVRRAIIDRLGKRG